MVKRNNILILIKVLLILGILFFYLTGCGPEKLSIAERISAFMEVINSSDRSAVQEHIHPDAADYSTTADGETWAQNYFNSAEDFTLGSLTISSSNAETTIDSTGISYNNDPIQFQMKEQEADNWFIIGIKVETGTDDPPNYETIILQ